MSQKEKLHSEYEQLLRLNTRAVQYQMSRICRPIKESLHTDAFFYSRLNSEGSYYHLGTRPDILEDYFYSDQLLTSPTLSRLNYIKTPEVKVWQPVSESQQDLLPICEYFLRNKLDSGITITRNFENYREMYYFGTHARMNCSNSYWLNRVNFLQDFIKYYSIEAKNVLNMAADYQIDLSQLIGKTFFKPKEESERQISISNFKQQLLMSSFADKNITRREAEVLQLCLQGKSAKIIASELNISPRTVENNIYQIRQKYNVGSILELVSMFNDF